MHSEARKHLDRSHKRLECVPLSLFLELFVQEYFPVILSHYHIEQSSIQWAPGQYNCHSSDILKVGQLVSTNNNTGMSLIMFQVNLSPTQCKGQNVLTSNMAGRTMNTTIIIQTQRLRNINHLMNRKYATTPVPKSPSTSFILFLHRSSLAYVSDQDFFNRCHIFRRCHFNCSSPCSLNFVWL